MTDKFSARLTYIRIIAITVITALTAYAAWSASYAVYAVCLTINTALTALLFRQGRTGMITGAATGAASAVLAFILSGNIYSVCFIMAFIPAGITAEIAMRIKSRRTGMILAIGVVYAVIAGSLIILYSMLNGPSFSLRGAADYMSQTIDSSVGDVISAQKLYYEMYYANAQGTQELEDFIAQFDKPEYAADVALYVKTIIFSVFLNACNIMAYFSSYLYIRLSVWSGGGSASAYKSKKKAFRVKLSAVSAFVMAVSVTASIALTRETNFAAIFVISNFVCLLSPGFFICGAYLLKDKAAQFFEDRKGLIVIGVFAVVFLFASGILNVTLALNLIILTGVWHTLFSSFKDFIMRIRKKT